MFNICYDVCQKTWRKNVKEKKANKEIWYESHNKYIQHTTLHILHTIITGSALSFWILSILYAKIPFELCLIFRVTAQRELSAFYL